MKLDAVAAAVGITVPHLSRMERGERPLTDVWMYRLARALACDPRELLGDAEGGPLPGEIVKDPDELALVRFWRSVTDAERSVLVRLMRPPALARDDAA